MKNPIREIRDRQHLTLEEFAGECGIHHQALFLNERGVYPHVLPAIIQRMRGLGVDTEQLQQDYMVWQREERAANGAKYGLPRLILNAPIPGQPVALFRKQLGLSKMKFAKCFGIHPAELSKLESGTKHSLSEQFCTAMTEAGLSDTVLSELKYRCGEYASGERLRT